MPRSSSIYLWYHHFQLPPPLEWRHLVVRRDRTHWYLRHVGERGREREDRQTEELRGHRLSSLWVAALSALIPCYDSDTVHRCLLPTGWRGGRERVSEWVGKREEERKQQRDLNEESRHCSQSRSIRATVHVCLCETVLLSFYFIQIFPNKLRVLQGSGFKRTPPQALIASFLVLGVSLKRHFTHKCQLS